MQPLDLQKFYQAITLFQQGHKAEAHAALLALSKSYPTEASLWLWLAYTSDDLVFARSYLYRVKLLDPENPSLPGADKWLAGEEAKKLTAPTPARPTPKATKPARINPLPPKESPPAVSVETSQARAAATFVKPETGPTVPPKIPEAGPVTKIKAAKIRPKQRGRIVISLVCLLIFVGLGGAIIAAIIVNGPGPDSLQRAGLPVYSGAVRLELTPQDRETIIKGYADTGQVEQVKNLEFEFYKLKKSDKNNALNYYDTELTKIGWLAPPRNSVNANSFNLNSYQKDKQYFFVFTSEIPPDAYPLPSIRSQLQPDELLQIVFRTEEI